MIEGTKILTKPMENVLRIFLIITLIFIAVFFCKSFFSWKIQEPLVWSGILLILFDVLLALFACKVRDYEVLSANGRGDFKKIHKKFMVIYGFILSLSNKERVVRRLTACSSIAIFINIVAIVICIFVNDAKYFKEYFLYIMIPFSIFFCTILCLIVARANIER